MSHLSHMTRWRQCWSGRCHRPGGRRWSSDGRRWKPTDGAVLVSRGWYNFTILCSGVSQSKTCILLFCTRGCEGERWLGFRYEDLKELWPPEWCLQVLSSFTPPVPPLSCSPPSPGLVVVTACPPKFIHFHLVKSGVGLVQSCGSGWPKGLVQSCGVQHLVAPV